MIKEIVSDTITLSQKATLATKDDLVVVQDLLDTIKAHEQACVGMAANMIGVNKRIIVVNDEGKYLVMLNPKVLKLTGNLYETKEGCLSHVGTKSVKRYEKIKVEFLDENFKIKIKTFSDYTAQIIQHELDHCEGILI